ncbi:hypothetical protein NG99_17025 [Erwinia typographi]|uniref:ParE-like toxin domain-containing protein n=1 Tax=Erwinia typographi TaxID=371042 RepID=A0A0A4A072_9GAMM|nr:hypothetical protein [Erwinia typographi]KGT91268.1 hypothetical protein NG99_17025 [Erwinia typographi]
MTLSVFKAPEWVIIQATKRLAQYRKRRVFPCRIHGTGYLSLRVNPRWRLLSRNNGKDWQLMTHAVYNNIKDGK